MNNIKEIKLTSRTSSGKLIRSAATLEYKAGRIWFLKSPFSLKDEIKAMKGSRWHGRDDDDDGRKIWSIEDCPRNRFQLGFLMGEDVYTWFDRDLIQHDYSGTRLNGELLAMMAHQCDMSDSGLTYHYQLWAAEMGTGKTLSAQKVIENSGALYWWWVGPKSSIPNIKREFAKWGFDFNGPIRIEFITYEELTRRMDEWKPGNELPQGVIYDESSRLKGDTSQRTQAAQRLADFIREKFGFDGYVIEMSGTPSPKSPLDWWSQCEIAWPGFLREGSRKALEQRCGFVVMQQFESGMFPKRIGWKDDEHKCRHCGLAEPVGPHELDGIIDPDEVHPFEPSVNEVAFMHERLKGLVVIKHKKDCLTLPDKRYRKIICKPNPSVLRVAQAIVDSAPNTITGLTLLRELSDGFQYRDITDGEVPCPHCPGSCGEIEEWFDPEDEEATYSAIDMLSEEFVARLQKRKVPCTRCGGDKTVPKIVRSTREIACPKEKALKMLLEECEENGRIVVFAGFTGSVDRVTNICHKDGWSVLRVDGRGFEVTDREGNIITQNGEDALEFWADRDNQRVAFSSHPESGGMSLTLVEARMAVYWSNSFKPEYRAQSEDRIHRKGMDENLGCDIVDLIHLPTDERVLEVIQANRKLELMTLGEFRDALDDEGSDDGVIVEELVA
ncbi:MAG: DEAD/DEAH box helicase [Pirellulales bacterium]